MRTKSFLMGVGSALAVMASAAETVLEAQNSNVLVNARNEDAKKVDQSKKAPHVHFEEKPVKNGQKEILEGYPLEADKGKKQDQKKRAAEAAAKKKAAEEEAKKKAEADAAAAAQAAQAQAPPATDATPPATPDTAAPATPPVTATPAAPAVTPATPKTADPAPVPKATPKAPQVDEDGDLPKTTKKGKKKHEEDEDAPNGLEDVEVIDAEAESMQNNVEISVGEEEKKKKKKKKQKKEAGEDNTKWSEANIPDDEEVVKPKKSDVRGPGGKGPLKASDEDKPKAVIKAPSADGGEDKPKEDKDKVVVADKKKKPADDDEEEEEEEEEDEKPVAPKKKPAVDDEDEDDGVVRPKNAKVVHKIGADVKESQLEKGSKSKKAKAKKATDDEEETKPKKKAPKKEDADDEEEEKPKKKASPKVPVADDEEEEEKPKKKKVVDDSEKDEGLITKTAGTVHLKDAPKVGLGGYAADGSTGKATKGKTDGEPGGGAHCCGMKGLGGATVDVLCHPETVARNQPFTVNVKYSVDVKRPVDIKVDVLNAKTKGFYAGETVPMEDSEGEVSLTITMPGDAEEPFLWKVFVAPRGEPFPNMLAETGFEAHLAGEVKGNCAAIKTKGHTPDVMPRVNSVMLKDFPKTLTPGTTAPVSVWYDLVTGEPSTLTVNLMKKGPNQPVEGAGVAVDAQAGSNIATVMLPIPANVELEPVYIVATMTPVGKAWEDRLGEDRTYSTKLTGFRRLRASIDAYGRIA